VEVLFSAELWPYIESVIDMDTVNGNIKKRYIKETSSVVNKFNLNTVCNRYG
jgi:hypothetical protein